MWHVNRDQTAALSECLNSRAEVLLDREAEPGDRSGSVSGESGVKPNWLHSRWLALHVHWIRLWGGRQEAWQERARLAA